MSEKIIKIYTDGACSGNPGKGGWGAILEISHHRKEISGAEAHTTNNRMELTATIEALKQIKKQLPVHIYTDSKYVMDGITIWINNWKKNGWRSANKKPVKNDDLWRSLDELNNNLNVKWHWVKGHSGHPQNERADELARGAIKTL